MGQHNSLSVSRGRNLGIAFLAQNCALGLTNGSYGTLVPSIQLDYHLNRALASAGLSAALFVLGALSPLVGLLIERFSLKSIMIVGAILCAGGYGLLAALGGAATFIIAYAGIGAGTCLLGILAPTTLVGRWFDTGQGKALGIVNLPVFMFLAPIIIARLLPVAGLRGVFLGGSAVFVLLVPALMLIKEHPGFDAVEQPTSLLSVSDTPPKHVAPPAYRSLSFWLLTLGIGILMGAGTVFIVHFVPFILTKGYDVSDAAFLFSGYGLAGIVGTYGFGWLADRLGSVNALCLNALVQAALWAGLLAASNFWLLLLIACLIGTCMTSLIALLGAAISSLFGVAHLGRIMGITYLFMIPFVFGASPIVGHVFDATQSYSLAFLSQIAAFLVAAIAFHKITIDSRRAVVQPVPSSS
jgi:MFS family permease